MMDWSQFEMPESEMVSLTVPFIKGFHYLLDHNMNSHLIVC